MEMASIAVFGGITVAAIVVAAVVPLATGLGALAPVPLALIAARTRPRALITAAVATTGVTFAMAGTGAAATVIGSAFIGGLVGELKRRGRGIGAVAVASLIAAPIIGVLSVLILLILVPLRNLALAALENTVGGLVKTLDKYTPFHALADAIDTLGSSMVDYWWVWMWVSGAIGAVFSILVAWWVLGGVIARLADIPSTDTLDDGLTAPQAEVAPLPLTMTGVGFRYRPDGPPVLSDVDLRIGADEFIAVVGANGSGKSTLAKILAGRAPTSGSVHRPGAAGLGRPGGTAMVLQRPESQMLGSRVADDLVWGLPVDADVDVDGLLAEVGLPGLGDRETSDLSGGQQQRLAIAAALARSPRLLIADEVTSMVDPAGRDDLLALLAGLPRRRGITVVLITHRGSEAASADRVIHLDAGRVQPEAPQWVHDDVDVHPASAVLQDAVPYDAAPIPILTLDHVGYTYLRGSPWEVEALRDVSLTVNRGDGLLIVGGNGSGKTTLAWIMAGLTVPTTGTCILGGKLVADRVGDVGLAFQHARLQLQRSRVDDEIMAAGGVEVGSAEVARVLELVGLPRDMAARQTDSLSGGQMRRLVLAGLIARHPKVLVLDEPLAGLDPYARTDIVNLLRHLRAEGMTLIIISHDFDSLHEVCNRQVHLVGGAIAAPNGRSEGVPRTVDDSRRTVDDERRTVDEFECTVDGGGAQ